MAKAASDGATKLIAIGPEITAIVVWEIENLAAGKNIRKISRRDLPVARARRLDCATTVASTAFIAHRAGIEVFATGGIGGRVRP